MEKRRVERFDLQIKTMLNVRDTATPHNLSVLFSRDISCDGVFLLTETPYPVGTNLDLNFLLTHPELGSKSRDEGINLKTRGKVIRTDYQGMAVEFDKQYKISQFRTKNNHQNLLLTPQP